MQALCQKTVTLPLRMFGYERSSRSIPTTLYCYVRLEGRVRALGLLHLRYEEAPGRNARLIVINSSLITRAYPQVRVWRKGAGVAAHACTRRDACGAQAQRAGAVA